MNFARLKSGYNATQSELELSAEQWLTDANLIFLILYFNNIALYN
jgi:hypothetical protein